MFISLQLRRAMLWHVSLGHSAAAELGAAGSTAGAAAVAVSDPRSLDAAQG